MKNFKLSSYKINIKKSMFHYTRKTEVSVPMQ